MSCPFKWVLLVLLGTGLLYAQPVEVKQAPVQPDAPPPLKKEQPPDLGGPKDKGDPKGEPKDPKKEGSTGEGTKKDPIKPGEVEARFGDGSAVRMIMLQESIEIVTKFGKLSVPTAEIRHIDLGIHLPEGVDKKIDAALKRLGSEVFKDRDAAVKELIALGPHAYPALSFAAKSSDIEVVKRAETAIKGIRQKYPADQLRTTINDRIQTTDFPIVGRIISPKIKARTLYFGDLDLKLAELRTINWLSGLIDLEISVDAGKYANRFNNPWMDTGVTLDGMGGLLITASGQVDLLNDGSGQGISGPEGNRNLGGGPGGGGRGGLAGTLVGKIGENGQQFTIGSRYQTTSTREGKLYVQIVPGPNWGGNQMATGAYTVHIKAGPNAIGN